MAKRGLLILGNGSNLHFGLKTQWLDYWEWRKSNLGITGDWKKELNWDFFDVLFCSLEASKKNNKNWSDIESCLNRELTVAFDALSDSSLVELACSEDNSFYEVVKTDSDFWKLLLKYIELHKLELKSLIAILLDELNNFEVLFKKYLLESAPIQTFYNNANDYNDFLIKLIDPNWESFDILDFNYEPLVNMLDFTVFEKLKHLYQPHGTVLSSVIIGGNTSKGNSNFKNKSSSKWARAQPIKYDFDSSKNPLLSDYNVNLLEYDDIVIYGWTPNRVDKILFLLDSPLNSWPERHTILLKYCYSVFPTFDKCNLLKYKTQLTDIELGLRNDLGKNKPKSIALYNFEIGDSDSWFDFEFFKIN